jgi:arylsulfatase A-like enzyme
MARFWRDWLLTSKVGGSLIATLLAQVFGSRQCGARFLAVLVALSLISIPADSRAQNSKPNFLVIMIDDAAWTDLGPYGGEAATPTIDALAKRGMLFSRYHTSPLCSPSRAMLLTGLTNHAAGVATIPEVLPPQHRGKPGYRLHLEPGAVTIAERLRDTGYRTLMSGKWHLGDRAQDLPNAHGFDRSFALDASGADNWDDKSYMPYYAEAPWYEDGKKASYPSGRYSSTVIVDKMIDYLTTSEAKKPFLAYVAFQAVHIPVQAPRAYSDHYKGRFDGGWDELAAQRFARAKASGLIPASATQPPMHPTMRRWSTLSRDEQKMQARAMEVYAGMIEAMDHEIGRLIAHLEASGQLANTIIVLTSDNGPEPSDPSSQTGFNQWAALHNYHRHLDDLGERGSTNWIGPEWASAVATPGYLFKFYATGGGTRVPFIVAGPGVQAGARTAASAFVSDITPTLLAFAGAGPAPSGSRPVTGRSLVPLLSGQADRIYGPEDGFGLEVSGNAAFFKDQFKLVRTQAPYGDGAWRLYDIVADPGETRDLSASNPAEFAALKAAYAVYAKANGVLDLPQGYQVQRQVAQNAWKRQLSLYGTRLGFVVLVLILGFVWLAKAKKKRAVNK